MRISRDRKACNVLAICMAMLYAFSTRTILSTVLYRTNIQVWLYYGVMYACLGISFVRSFVKTEGHLYAPKAFFGVLSIMVVMAYSMYSVGNLKAMLYYGIAILLPFAFIPEMKLSEKTGKLITWVGLFFAVGCFINFLFPTLFQAVFYPMFTESAQASLEEVKGWIGDKMYYAGFTSQVGYTSFFLSTAIGTVFCFRKTIFRKSFLPIEMVFFFALLLTGKRGPFLFVLGALTLVYLAEGSTREKFNRMVKICGLVIIGYLALLMISKYTEIDGIQRILESIQNMIKSGSVSDVGRNQLHTQAIEYFMESPLFGIGWAHFKDKFYLRSTHVHCIYLQLLCETGLVGFSVFLCFFASRVLATTRMIKQTRSPISTVENGWIELSLFIQVYFLLYGITGNPLYDAEETIIYFFAIGISYLPLLNGIRGTK